MAKSNRAILGHKPLRAQRTRRGPAFFQRSPCSLRPNLLSQSCLPRFRGRRSIRALFFAAALSVGLATRALAHEGKPPAPHDLWEAWSAEPLVIAGLALSAWFYIRGRRRMATDKGRRWETIAFFAGWLALFIALISPLDSMGGALFSAHMAQHEILMLVAAPLVVLGRPMAPVLLGLPANWRRRVAGVGKARPARVAWRMLIGPFAAWLIHAAVLWAWHAPALFQATLESGLVHAAQHMSFLGSALLFCEALVYGRERRLGYGAAVLYVFTTAVHTSALGALMTFSQTAWYPAYSETTAAWGLTPLEDQQLGGLIMWVPAGVIYLAAGLLLFGLWLRESERRAVRREAAPEAGAGGTLG
jgi:putative membrane protein